MGMDTISPGEAVSYVGQRGILFVDIRDKRDYQNGHIPGAVQMTYEDLLAQKAELDKYKIVIIYCDRGNASLLAARELRTIKAEVKSIAYGMSEYRGPLVKSRL